MPVGRGPAHNEEAVIGRCLTALFAGAEEGELDVWWCARVPRPDGGGGSQGGPLATVVESRGVQGGALNAGDRAARYFLGST